MSRQLGLLYNANYDEELIEERLYAKSLCHEYNQLHPRNIEERETLIKTLLGKTTDRFLIEQPFVCDYGYNIEIGENFYSNHNTIMLDGAKIV
ncbi:maltose acetyltransferase domain-containing protein, partial [Paenibacillus polymyxa]|uniref:maltose acetyltransferase domain-containing protein n=1 Tax=Paenibacillus polymyxa TaxID=1406 RepID=UPI0006C421B2